MVVSRSGLRRTRCLARRRRCDARRGTDGRALGCRTIHGSLRNQSDRDRPLLLVVYSSADSFAYTASPIASPRLGEIVRGQPARFASFDTRRCELPPDWAREGYGSPWRRQRAAEQASVTK